MHNDSQNRSVAKSGSSSVFGFEKLIDDFLRGGKHQFFKFPELDDVFQTYNLSLNDNSFPFCNQYIQSVDGSLVLEIALAGYSKDLIDIETEDHYLVVKGKKKLESADIKWLKKQISAKEFEVTYQIPKHYDMSSLQAKMENGMLFLTFKLKPECTPKKVMIE